MRHALIAGVVLGLVVACHHTRARTPQQEGIARTRSHGACPASGIHSNGTCPKIDVPSVNASSAEGCKSDAACGDGPSEPRCIENPSFAPERHSGGQARNRGNLFGAAPRPPAPTECVQDACHLDADCSRGFGCECGSGEGADRNRCIQLDTCLTDADCEKGSRCQCDSTRPNYCMPSNCDTAAECDGKACSESSPIHWGGQAGRYCRTPKDTCAKDEDCKTPQGRAQQCVYDGAQSLWTCVEIEPPPPG